MTKDLISASLKFHRESLKKNQKALEQEKNTRDKKLIQNSAAYSTDSEEDDIPTTKGQSRVDLLQDTFTKNLPKSKKQEDSSDDEIVKPVYRGAWSDDSSSDGDDEELEKNQREQEVDSDDEGSNDVSSESGDSSQEENDSGSESENSSDDEEVAVKGKNWEKRELHVSARDRSEKVTADDRDEEAKEAAFLQKKRAERLKKSVQETIEKEYATESEEESEDSDEEQTNEELEQELVNDLKVKLDFVQKQLEPLLQKIRETGFSTHDGLSYLEVKYQLLLSYCMNIVFFFTLKANGDNVDDHPVIEYLVEQRKLLEKVKPIDDRMKNQLDKLISLASRTEYNEVPDNMSVDEDEEDGSDDEKTEKGMRPTLSDFMDDDDISDDSSVDSSSDEEDNEMVSGKKEDIYVAPKLMAVSTNMESRDKKMSKYEKRKEKLKQRLVESGIIDDLKDYYGDAPVVQDSNGGVRNKNSKAAQFVKELEEYEMSSMKRVHLNKDQKKLIREASKASAFEDEFRDLEAYSEYVSHEAREKSIEDERVTVLEYLENEAEARKFLEKQNKKESAEEGSKKRKRIQEPTFESDDDSEEDLATRKRRRLEEEQDNGEEVGRRGAGEKELRNRGIRHNKRKDLKNSRVKYKKRFEEKTARHRNLENQMEKLRSGSGFLPKIDANTVRSHKAK